MDEEIEVPEIEVRPNVSQQLKQAREAAGLTIKDIATKTRVPIRHLENLEAENFAALPGLTYVLGFVRNYARALELDEVALVDELRTDLAGEDSLRRNYADSAYAPADPAHIPPKSFAWGALGVLVAILIGFGIYKAVTSGMFAGTNAPEVELVAEEPETPKPAATAPIGEVSGPVVLSATDDVWLRVYTDDGKKLLEKVMVKGESFTIPADVAKPLLLTGRPQVLNVTVAGKAVPPLGPPDRTVADLDISASALTAKVKAATAETTPNPDAAATAQ